MLLWEAFINLLYWWNRKVTAAPPPYVDPDWDDYLRQKYGIKQAIDNSEEAE